MKPVFYKIRRLKRPLLLETLVPSSFDRAVPALLKEAVKGGAPRRKTEARLMHDGKSLYALFQAEADNPMATLRDHDGPLYNENVVELFIDPLGLGKIYYELEVNPLNASFDAVIINNVKKEGGRGDRFQGFTAWNPKSLVHRSEVSGKLWTVYMKIDFADLFISKEALPKKGARWRGNMLRVDVDASGTEYQAFSPPLMPDFHNSATFAAWVFD